MPETDNAPRRGCVWEGTTQIQSKNCGIIQYRKSKMRCPVTPKILKIKYYKLHSKLENALKMSRSSIQ